MPALNVRKKYRDDSIYHVYNRGALGSEIFFDPSDYFVFRKIARNTLREQMGEVQILSFALMPNHYHFLLKQRSGRSIIKFMQSIAIKYSMYLRRTYSHHGRLFEGPYKAVLLMGKKDIDRIHHYIADNPITGDLHDWPHVGTQI